MAQGTELDIGNISALIIESADREGGGGVKLIKTNKKRQGIQKEQKILVGSAACTLKERGKGES